LNALVVAMLCSSLFPRAVAQIQVTGANPNSGAQGTLNLNVQVSGNGFKKGARAQWFLTGTTNPGGVTVNSTTFNNSGLLTASITVAANATIGNFDIQVTNSDGRTGKGTELFAVKSPGNSGSCVAPAPISPVVNACSSSTPQTGCIDSTFGSSGAALLLDTSLAPQGAIRLQPQADGTQKIVIANQTGSSATVARFNLDGTLDSTFGSGGISSYQLQTSGGISIGGDVTIDGNRNILVVGQAGPLFVMRFLPNGGADTSFGSNGVFNYQPSPSGFAEAAALALQPDGKIVVVGSQSTANNHTAALVLRLNSNGTLDSTFGNSGITSIIFPGSKNGALLRTVAIQPVGTTNYVVTGAGGWFGRLTPSGVIDSSFGSGGQVVGPTCGGTGNARGTYVDASGNIYLLGYSDAGTGSGNYISLTKYTASGVLDTTFGDASQSGHTGDTFLNVFDGSNYPGFNSSLIATTDSSGVTKLLLTGQASGSAGTTSVLARYNLNGTLDATFPVAARTFGSGAAWGMGSVVEPNGEIVPFIVWDNSGGYLALTRYWP
jgi:uncharacterized delta-60 repeat protein